MRYAAPEVARSRLDSTPVRVTKAIDVWAMALVLFHFFSGASLWGDMEVDEQMVAERPEEAVQRLEADRALTEPQRRLLKEMLVVDPAKRKPLEEVLAKGFFKEGEDTEQAKFIEVLALFSSPKQLRNGKGIPPLQLMREIVAMQTAIPRRLREIRPAARFPVDIEPVLRQLTPRIVQFSGHGDAVKRGAYAGALAFELADGTIQLPDPQSFVDLLRKEMCPRLELVFLNGCKTLHPLGEQIVAELPHLTVIGWDSVSADAAASAFAQGFYDSIARNCGRVGGMSGAKHSDLWEAYSSAERAFMDGGYIRGDPTQKTEGKPQAHGIYGILGHVIQAHRSSSIGAGRRSSTRLSMGGTAKLAVLSRRMSRGGSAKDNDHNPLPLLPEKGESTLEPDESPGNPRRQASMSGGEPPLHEEVGSGAAPAAAPAAANTPVREELDASALPPAVGRKGSLAEGQELHRTL